MRDDLRATVLHTVGDVLERAVFMFCEPADEQALPDGCADLVKAEMTFRGDAEGSIMFVVPRELCEEIAANALGLEPGSAEARAGAEDALCELLNVVCGHLLTAVWGDGAVFDLSAPRAAAVEEDQWRDLVADPDSLALIMEDRPFLLRFSIGEQA